MKLFQYWKNGRCLLGMQTAAGMIDVAATVEGSGKTLPKTMDELIAWQGDREALSGEYAALAPVFIEAPAFAPVVTGPRKILCIGLNYNDHIAETGLESRPGFPPVFCKYANALAAHDEAIHLPAAGHQFDYEAELVIVMGKAAKNVSAEDALSYVFGYACGNDFSCRDLQFSSSQWTLGKTCDGFAPIGPYIVTADSIDPNGLDIASYVNGERRQSSNTAYMIYSCAEIISHLSRFITLMPGDLIYTGTPSGVILGMPKEQQVWLTPGDHVEIEIEGLGRLNTPLLAPTV